MTRHNAALNQARQDIHDHNVTRALTQATGSTSSGTIAHLTCDPADARLLRGIPAIGGRGSLGGHIPGTRPDHYLPDNRQKQPRTRNTKGTP